MATYRALVKNYLDQRGVKYREPNDHVITVTYTGEKLNEITVIINFDDEEGKAEFYNINIGQFTQEQFAKGLIACNTCNAKYRWVKFYIEDDNHICVRSDAILDTQTCGEECFDMIQLIVGIVDDAYPVFMKTRWA